jgi:hypothetical protein
MAAPTRVHWFRSVEEEVEGRPEGSLEGAVGMAWQQWRVSAIIISSSARRIQHEEWDAIVYLLKRVMSVGSTDQGPASQPASQPDTGADKTAQHNTTGKPYMVV